MRRAERPESRRARVSPVALPLDLAAACPLRRGARLALAGSERIEEPLGILRGEQLIHYRNRSPDTLRTFSLHLHLNAFRPGSRWSDGDSVEQRRRFNDLKDPDYAYNHVANVKIMGRDVKPIYPFAPDSTIVRFDLPAPLAPGDSMVVTMEWDARLSTVARRQGRRGRHYDFAHWYPKVVVYDRFGWNENPLVAAGEFYGEFATYRVQLDVPEDQVVGMTGVPLCGDPGWAGANQAAGVPVQYGAEVYPEAAKAITGPGPGKNGACAFHEFFRHDPEIAEGPVAVPPGPTGDAARVDSDQVDLAISVDVAPSEPVSIENERI